MDLYQLKIFCAVVELESFSKASEIVFLSQPTISFQIKSLEQELGTRLLIRQRRRVEATKTGEELYRYARRILRLSEEARQSIEELKGLVKGELNIGASTIPGEYILPDLLAEFKGQHPGVNINLVIGDTKEITEKIVDSEIEVGIVGSRERENSKLIFNSFTTDRLVLITPPKHSWLNHQTITIDELKKVPFISRERGSGTRATIMAKLQEIGIGEKDLNIVMRLGSTSAIKKAVESGAGVSLVSEKAIDNEIKVGSITRVPIKDLNFVREFFIICRRQKHRSPTAESLLKFLEEKKAEK